MKKSILSILLALLPFVANAEPVEIDGIWYNLVSKVKTAEVTKPATGEYSGEKKIPDKVNYDGTDYSVTSIGESAFSYCSGLTSVTIPNSVTSIGNFAFGGCSGLTSVHISDLKTWCEIEFSGYDSNPLYDAHHLYLNGEEIKDMVLPNSVTSIGESAFSGCSGLTSVTIPNSVTSIGDQAFYGCSGLTSVTIPNGVTSIGYAAFSGCSGLTSVTIPNSVTSIGNHAFDGCSSLTSVTIPNSVTSIEEGAFYKCSGLTSVTIPNSVTNIGSDAFRDCSGLTSVTIPNKVTSIGDFAFWGCSGLTSVTIPNSVTSIGHSAFYGCSGLTSVTIPNSVTSIGGYAFYECTNLLSVTSNIDEPYNIEKNVFNDETYRKGTLYVPQGTKELYARFDGWRNFLKIEEKPSEVAGLEKCARPVITIKNGVINFSCATPGARIKYEYTTEGDVMNNGKLTANNINIIIIAKAVADGYNPSDVAAASFSLSDLANGDVNGDGQVDVADHVKLSEIIMGQ